MKLLSTPLFLRFSAPSYTAVIWSSSIARDINGCPSPQTKNTKFKPVGFATHSGMLRTKPVPNDGVLRPSGFRFGEAEEEFFDCLILFESKLTINDAVFGQVVLYLQNLLPEASASAILFDHCSFWFWSKATNRLSSKFTLQCGPTTDRNHCLKTS
jgi:hypothetical protein